MERTKRLIDNIFTPVMEGAVERLNEHLAKDGVKVGVDFSWFMDFTED